MRRFAVVGAVAGASLLLSACDASPYAVTVNGTTISQVSLNHQLSQWSSNGTWVSSFNDANSSANGGTGVTVAGAGGAGTYSSSFVADILSNMVESEIVQQHLASSAQAATAEEVTTSRAINEYLRSAYWAQFPPTLRQFLVTQLADQAVLTPVSTDASTLQSAYKAIKPYLFSQVCLREATVFSQAEAQADVASRRIGGSTLCYTQEEIESETKAFRSAVYSLGPGTVTSVAGSGRYILVQLVSRQSPGFSAGVRQVLSVAVASNQSQEITGLVGRARVKVNPTYGSWSAGHITPPTLRRS